MTATVDWTGRTLVVLTWLLLVFANYVTVSRIFNNWFRNINSWSGYSMSGTAFLVIYQLLYCSAFLCHLRAFFGDPGSTDRFVSRESPVSFVNPRICKFCNHRWKPPRAHHCRKCKRCVFRMDHHCTWIDNCVGIGNQKFFILFLIYTGLLCIYQLFLLVVAAIRWMFNLSRSISLSSVCLSLCVLLESVGFLFVTSNFLSEQIEAIITNSTLIESHQHTHGIQRDFWFHFTEVFGSRWLLWPLPIRPSLKLDATEPVFLDEAVASHLLLHKHKARVFNQQQQQQQKKRKSVAALQPVSDVSLLNSTSSETNGAAYLPKQTTNDNDEGDNEADSEFRSQSSLYVGLLQSSRMDKQQQNSSNLSVRQRRLKHSHLNHHDDDQSVISSASSCVVEDETVRAHEEHSSHYEENRGTSCSSKGSDRSRLNLRRDETSRSSYNKADYDYDNDNERKSDYQAVINSIKSVNSRNSGRSSHCKVNREDDGPWGKEEFKNICIKPLTDLGVELSGDGSRFIHLEDLDAANDEDEDADEDNEAG